MQLALVLCNIDLCPTNYMEIYCKWQCKSNNKIQKSTILFYLFFVPVLHRKIDPE